MTVMAEDEAPGRKACENLQRIEWNWYSRVACTVRHYKGVIWRGSEGVSDLGQQ